MKNIKKLFILISLCVGCEIFSSNRVENLRKVKNMQEQLIEIEPRYAEKLESECITKIQDLFRVTLNYENMEKLPSAEYNRALLKPLMTADKDCVVFTDILAYITSETVIENDAATLADDNNDFNILDAQDTLNERNMLSVNSFIIDFETYKTQYTPSTRPAFVKNILFPRLKREFPAKD